MPLPASVPTGTVTGRWYTPSGADAVGTAHFQLLKNIEVPDDPDGEVINAPVIRVNITAGVLNQTLPAGDYYSRVRLENWYEEAKLIRVTAGQATNWPDAEPLEEEDTTSFYQPVKSVEGIFPDSTGNIDLPGGGGGGVTDHGALTGLGDDDHTQYHNDARGDARYYTKAQVDTSLAGKENTGVAASAVAAHVAAADPHTQYALESSLASVATSGAYNDLSGKPTIPVASDDFPASVGQFNTAGSDPDFSRSDHTHNGIPQTLLTAKGDLVGASASNTAVRIPVGTNGQSLKANSGQASGLNWARDERAMFPIEELGLVAANENPANFRDPSPMGTNGWIVAIYVPAGAPITGCVVGVHTAGTLGAGGNNGFAIYDASGTKIGETPNDDALFQTTGVRTKALNSVIAAQATGRLVYVELRREGWTSEPSFSFLQTAAGSGFFDGGWPSGIRRSFILGGTGHPASINPASTGSSGGGYMPFIGLY